MRTGTETHDSHIPRITPERGNVVLHPREQRLLVLQSQVEQSLPGRQRRRQEAKCADAVVEADSHDVLLCPRHEAGHVPLAAMTGVEAAPVDVDDDWQKMSRLGYAVYLARNSHGISRAEDVGVQTVFALGLAGIGAQTGVTVRSCLESGRGVRHGHGRPEAVLTRRRLGVGDAEEAVDGPGVRVGVGLDGGADVSALAELDACAARLGR